jgi:hypothetical protein
MDVEQKTNTVLVASDDVCEGDKRGRWACGYWLLFHCVVLLWWY